MKKTLLILIAALSTSLCISGKKKALYDNSICWEITGNGSKAPSYILGSIHMIDTTRINFPVNTIKGLIDRCACFCTEINFSDSTAMAMDPMQLFITDPELKKIPDLIGQDYYKKLMHIADSSKTELKEMKPALHVINPAYLSLMVTGEKQLGKSDLFQVSNFKMDVYFSDYADYYGYKKNGLETMQEQMDLILASESAEESAENLKKAIDDYFSDNDDAPKDMLENYIKQNLKLLATEGFTNPGMISRNNKMAEGIDNIMKEKPVFVIIGAAHLPYEHGVLNLLNSKGYTVKPYNITISAKK